LVDRAARDGCEIRSSLVCWFRLREREPPEDLAYRRELLSGLSGRVLDLGAGDGANSRTSRHRSTRWSRSKPEPYLRDRARRNAQGAPVPISVVDALADDLPLEDSGFDAGVVALVLCTVPYQAAALAERTG
jgi:SAM-dependent methyltransferase